jgi:D-hexose-6-phosphate mutarotase
MQNIDNLNQQFSIPGHIDFVEGPGGLTIARINNDIASAEIALQGAHLFSWQPRGAAPVIWLSPDARFEKDKAIRGGVPVCWPWFGFHEEDLKKPAHGFVRTAIWAVAATEALDDGRTSIRFTLTSNDHTLTLWPYAFRLNYTVTVGQKLDLQLITENTGDTSFNISEALHTYFAIGDIDGIEIHGLAGYTYADKADDMTLKMEAGPILIHNEVDHIYLDTQGECRIEDRLQQRRINISTQGSHTTVVWNPWIEKSAKMGDMGKDGYRTMVCVESANALNNRVTVEPGRHHELMARYELA